jgi:hypothetical protein
MAEEVLQKTTFLLEMKEDLGDAPQVVGDALQQIGKIAEGLNAILLKTAGPLGTLAAGTGAYEIVSKSLDVARQADQAVARLKSAAGGSDSVVQQIQQLVKSLSSTTVFNSQNLLATAADLLTRGVPQSQLPQALKASVELASALRIDLADAGKELAQTFGGTVPRDLGRAIPQLRSMTSEALQLGGAVGEVLKKFSGQSAAQAQTPFGQAELLAGAVNDQYKALGDQLIKLETQVLPVAVTLLTSFNTELASPAGQKFLEVVGKILSNSLRLGPALGAIALASRGLSGVASQFGSIAEQAGKAADKAEKVAGATSGSLALGLRGASAAAGGYLGYTVAGTSGILPGAAIASAVESVPGVGEVAAAALVADALYILASRLLGVNTDFDSFDKQLKLASDTLNNLASGKTTLTSIGNAALGVTADFLRGHGVDIATAQDDPAKTQIDADNAAAPKAQDLIAARKDKLLGEINQLDQQFADLEKQSAARTSDDISKADAEANKKKLALRLETLQQYVQQAYEIERAGTDKTLAQLNEQIHDLDEKSLRDRAAGNYAQADAEAQKRNSLLTEYNQLLARSRDLAAAQADETLRLAGEQAQAAKGELDRTLSRNSGLVSAGQRTPAAGSAAANQALAEYAARLADVRSVLSDLASKPGDIGAAAKQAIAAIDEEAADVAAKTRAAISDIRPLAQAAHEAAVSLQHDLQEGLSKTLDEILDKTKSVSQAFREFGKSFLENVIHQSTSRFSELLVGGASGGNSGGGLFQLLGTAATGDGKGFVSSLLGGLFGSGSAASTGGGATGSSGPSQSAQANSSILGGVVKLLPSLLGLFDSGGYTGDGSPGQIAGLVHAGEYVVDAGTVSSLGGASVMNQFFGRVSPSVATRNLSLPGSSSAGGGGIAGALAAAARGGGGAGGGATVFPVLGVNEDLVSQAYNHPSSPRILSQVMLSNPSHFGPAIKALSK